MFHILFLLIAQLLSGTIQKEEEIRKLQIHIGNFEHYTSRYPSHVCCWEEIDKDVCSYCGIRYKLMTEFDEYELDIINSQIPIFEIETTTSFYDGRLFVMCLNLSIYVTESTTDQLIDEWKVTCLNLPIGEFYNISSELGNFENVKATFSIWFYCSGYGGVNCAKICIETTRSYCDEQGNLQCKDGFFNPPDCFIDSPCLRLNPCLNGGVCQTISTTDYNCQCLQPFKGKNCEEIKCDPNVCAGICENGECLCRLNQNDPTCTNLLCDRNIVCFNNGTCKKISDKEFCVCPPSTSGIFCQYHCDPQCVFGKCRKDDNFVDYCECQHGFIGIACDKRLPILDEPTSQPNKILHPGIIAGIVIAVFVEIATITTAGYFIYEKYKKKPKIKNDLIQFDPM